MIHAKDITKLKKNSSIRQIGFSVVVIVIFVEIFLYSEQIKIIRSLDTPTVTKLIQSYV